MCQTSSVYDSTENWYVESGNVFASPCILFYLDASRSVSPSTWKIDLHSGPCSRKEEGGGERTVEWKDCLDNRRRLHPLPSVFLSNTQSLRHKIDELEIWAKFKSEIKECCLFAITEGWLNEGQDSNVALTGFGCPFRLDCSSEATGNAWRRGLFLCQPALL